jgi:serine/threonine-protein kinase HipA
MPMSQLFVFCYLPGAVEAVPAGRFDHDDQTGTGLFHYGRRYLERPDAVALDPVALPLGGLIRPVQTNGGLYGAFRDASPDFWGRLVIAARLRCPVEAVSEIDFLLQANATRVGNLDFRRSLDDPEPGLEPPQFQDLRDLLEASDELEQGHPVSERLRVLLEQGSSLGGARPKCTVELDGALWLAKFPSHNDRISVPRLEFATMGLAQRCGLNVPDIRLLTVGGRDVFLIRRFDRSAVSGGWTRCGFLSSLSLAEWDERDRLHWSYRMIADRLRRYSVRAAEDLGELFRRIAFNILVRNTDDHPRNHGFLAEPGNGVSLSPLFDVVPSLTREGVGSEFFLAMGVGNEGRLASLENLCSVAEAFNLSSVQAGAICAQMQAHIAGTWRDHFSEAGFDTEQLDLIAPSFSPIEM